MAGGLTAQRDRLLGSGAYRHMVTVQAPGPTAPDGDGGYAEAWIDATPPTWSVSIAPAGRTDGEAQAAGTTIATASHVMRGRYRPDVTTRARIVFAGRLFNVITVRNLDERNRALELVCVEVLA